jgi:transcriptional regulator with XRE-family HTH domain
VVVSTPRSQKDPERSKLWERRRRAVGARIRELRVANGLSQESLALESGVSRDQLIQMEHGRRGLVVERLYDLADVLGVPASELLVDDRDQ